MAKKGTKKDKKKKSKRLAGAISARLPGTELVAITDNGWQLKGELALSCSCEVFCPCVVSLGAAPPTHGYCQAWVGVRIDEGHKDGVPLSGVNLALMLDIPGRMGEGGWTAALYVDEGASAAQVTAVEQIISGAAGGTTGLFKLLIANFLGTKRVPVSYTTDGGVRTLQAGKAILGSIQPINGASKEKLVTIENTSYWMGPQVIIARGLRSKVRDFGRVWNFDECSAEICHIEWSGP